MRGARLLALVVALASLDACAHAAPGPEHAAIALPFRRVELFFGRSRAQGPEISDAEWQSFVESVLTPAFPDGFTVVDARGQWRASTGAIDHESSKLVIILVPEAKVANAPIDRVTAAYKERFHQESVLVTITLAAAKF